MESISLDSLSKQENFSFNIMMSVTIHFQNFTYSLNFFKIIHQKVKNTYKFITVYLGFKWNKSYPSVK